MDKWCRLRPNALFVFAAVCALAAFWSAASGRYGPGITAHPQEVELGEGSSNETLPVQVTLRNHTRQPIRLLWAEES